MCIDKNYIVLSFSGAQSAPHTERYIILESNRRIDFFNFGTRIKRATKYIENDFDVSIYLLRSKARRVNPRAKGRKYAMTIKSAQRIERLDKALAELFCLISSRFNRLWAINGGTEEAFVKDICHNGKGKRINMKSIYDNDRIYFVPRTTILSSVEYMRELLRGVVVMSSNLLAAANLPLNVDNELDYIKRHSSNRWEFIKSCICNKVVLRAVQRQQPRYYKIELGCFGRVRYTQNPCYLTARELHRLERRIRNNPRFLSTIMEE